MQSPSLSPQRNSWLRCRRSLASRVVQDPLFAIPVQAIDWAVARGIAERTHARLSLDRLVISDAESQARGGSMLLLIPKPDGVELRLYRDAELAEHVEIDRSDLCKQLDRLASLFCGTTKRQGWKGRTMQDHEHPRPTRRNQYRYLFTAKHHGESEGAAQWSPDLSEEDEFTVFDGADDMELSDEDGNLYGAIRDGEDSLRDLGIWQEQIAEFPCAAEEMPWHGYPVWAINHEGPSNRRNQKHRPAREVFNRMVEVGLITVPMRARLLKGGHV